MGSPYQSQSASGYNASPPPDDGTTVAANKITWAVTKTKLADPIKTEIDAVNTQLLTALDMSHNTTSINYTTLVSDHLKPIEVTGTTSISLGDASTMTAGTLGYRVYVVNKGVATVTVNLANAANTLDGTVNGTQSIYPGGVGIFSVNQARNGYYSLAGMKGNTWAVPGSIGSTTPNAGAFTTLSASGAVSLTAAGTALSVTNGATIGGTLGVTNVLTATGGIQLSGQSTNAAETIYVTVNTVTLRGGTGGYSFNNSANTQQLLSISDAGAVNVVAGLLTASAGLTVSSGQTLTLTGATVAGAPTWSSSQAITLSTAAQPSITSVGTISTDFQPLGSSIPQNSQSVAYTTIATDANKHILHPTADNNPRTFTIDSNANVAYKIGTTITFVNEINTVTIAITTDTLLLAGTASTGSRTLAAGGIATALKKGATSWIISGTGLS